MAERHLSEASLQEQAMPFISIQLQAVLGTYPVCLVSGRTHSPCASQEDLTNFINTQFERCSKRPGMALGFYADVVAPSLKFQDMLDQKTAYSVGETLRLAGAQVLDMEPDDLQLLVTHRRVIRMLT